jgi:TolA-binding protein
LHPRPSSFNSDQLASDGPSIGRRLFRALTRFFIAVLIGVGATLAWQSHGDDAKRIVRTWAPSLAWLLPVSTTTSPPDGPVPAQNAALPQSAPLTQSAAPASAVAVGELVQQIEPITRDLTIVRRSLEQIAAKQEQMAQNIATLQAAEQDIRQKMSSPPPTRPASPRKPPEAATQSSAVQSSSVPPPPPPARPPLPLR